jgi:hydrogenase maturation protease
MMNHALTVVLGLGNVILSDDGLGVRALERLSSDPRLPQDVTLIDGGTLGLELLSCTAGAERLLILDAIELDAAPGTPARLAGDELLGLPGSASVHQLGVADLLAALRIMGEEPDAVVLLGVQPQITTLGTELSADVARALPALVEAAIEEIASWSSQQRGSECTR